MVVPWKGHGIGYGTGDSARSPFNLLNPAGCILGTPLEEEGHQHPCSNSRSLGTWLRCANPDVLIHVLF